ncbi:MAG: ZIP family metal transporter [Solirubrobacterales bacterium]
MPELLVLILAACGTALATGLGAVPVFMLGAAAKGLTPLLLGLAAGVMSVAAVLGLLVPAAEEGSVVELMAGCAVGVAFLAFVGRRFDSDAQFMGRGGASARTSGLVFLVLFVHSLPEGFAVGTAFASDRAGLSLFVILAIAIQNVPEGTAVAIPMREAGFGAGRQFWTAVATSAPQPLGAVVAYLAVEEVGALLPLSFAFAAGAMLALVASELLPSAYEGGERLKPSAGIAVGVALMVAISLWLGV